MGLFYQDTLPFMAAQGESRLGQEVMTSLVVIVNTGIPEIEGEVWRMGDLQRGNLKSEYKSPQILSCLPDSTGTG